MEGQDLEQLNRGRWSTRVFYYLHAFRCAYPFFCWAMQLVAGKASTGGEGRAAIGRLGGDRASNDGDGWHEVAVPPTDSVRAREWRIVVETCRAVVGARIEGARQRRAEGVMGMEVELVEVRLERGPVGFALW